MTKASRFVTLRILAPPDRFVNHLGGPRASGLVKNSNLRKDRLTVGQLTHTAAQYEAVWRPAHY